MITNCNQAYFTNKSGCELQEVINGPLDIIYLVEHQV